MSLFLSPPMGQVHLLRGVRLTSDFAHCGYWEDELDQYNSFLPMRVAAITQFTFIRENSSIRFEHAFTQESAQSINYIQYRNLAHDGKWMYAFVTKVNYISETVIEYELKFDFMTTYFFDYRLMECFIERHHVINDDNPSTTIENIEYGDRFVRSKYGAEINRDGQLICIQSSVASNGTDAVGGYFSNVYSGLDILASTSADDVNNFLKSATAANKSDAIVNIFMMPRRMYSGKNNKPVEYDWLIPTNKDFGGYIPHNNKLYMYPYNYCLIVNSQGDGAEFPYEYFTKNQGRIGMKIIGLTSGSPKIACVPQYYKGNIFDTSAMLTISSFPQCAWTIDTYRAYLAQNANQLPVNMMAASAGAGASLFNLVFGSITNPTNIAGNASNVFGVVQSGISIAQQIAKVSDIKSLPPQAHGNGTAAADVMFAYNGLDFYALGMSISPYQAQKIDGYFDMFGYAIKQVGLPQRKTRINYTYIKTANCNIHSHIPVNYHEAIKNVFNSGVTFWVDHRLIGNYQIANDSLQHGYTSPWGGTDEGEGLG